MHDEQRRPSASAAGAPSATFLFADIAGYTALTEAHGDEQAADLVAEFFEAVSEELPSCGGTHVKTIGDALVLRIPDPAQAVLLGLRITHELLRGHGAPAVRVGLHHGPAIERDGDYFGAAVNLAARVAACSPRPGHACRRGPSPERIPPPRTLELETPVIGLSHEHAERPFA